MIDAEIVPKSGYLGVADSTHSYLIGLFVYCLFVYLFIYLFVCQSIVFTPLLYHRFNHFTLYIFVLSIPEDAI